MYRLSFFALASLVANQCDMAASTQLDNDFNEVVNGSDEMISNLMQLDAQPKGKGKKSRSKSKGKKMSLDQLGKWAAEEEKKEQIVKPSVSFKAKLQKGGKAKPKAKAPAPAFKFSRPRPKDGVDIDVHPTKGGLAGMTAD